MYFLNHSIEFPPVAQTSEEGVLAIGGDLSVPRLLLAYKRGIFPWYNDEEPIIWWSPDPRFILIPDELKVSKSMKQVLRNRGFEVTVNRNFRAVIEYCSKIKRDGQEGTWITNEMMSSYIKLHELGFAKSVEVWLGGTLVGGLYGLDLNNGVFCGESMFSLVSNASKVALITFIQNSNYELFDCQVYTNHLASLGAKDISRDLFLTYLNP